MDCKLCSSTGPEGVAHHHIIIKHGQVVTVWYVSGDGYWDRELDPDEYFVEYRPTQQQ